MKEIKPLIKWGWLRAIMFFLSGFVIMAVYRPLRDFLFVNTEGKEYEFLFYTRTLKLALFVLVLFLFKKYIDKQDFKLLGFYLNRESKKHLLYGLALGVSIPLLILLVLLLFGQVKIIDFSFQTDQMLFIAGLFLSVAFFEELVYRAYWLQNLMCSMNKFVALAIVSVFFAIIHADNIGANPLAISNVFLQACY